MSLIERLSKKLNISEVKARKVRTAFVEALVEEVEARFGAASYGDIFKVRPNRLVPLVIEGLGSFKLRKRPARSFDAFRKTHTGGPAFVDKPPAQRLVMSTKWKDL